MFEAIGDVTVFLLEIIMGLVDFGPRAPKAGDRAPTSEAAASVEAPSAVTPPSIPNGTSE